MLWIRREEGIRREREAKEWRAGGDKLFLCKLRVAFRFTRFCGDFLMRRKESRKREREKGGRNGERRQAIFIFM